MVWTERTDHMTWKFRALSELIAIEVSSMASSSLSVAELSTDLLLAREPSRRRTSRAESLLGGDFCLEDFVGVGTLENSSEGSDMLARLQIRETVLTSSSSVSCGKVSTDSRSLIP